VQTTHARDAADPVLGGPSRRRTGTLREVAQ
jgi:hypothetical protein